MSIFELELSFDEAVSYLNNLASSTNKFVFRGQTSADYKMSTTWSRKLNNPNYKEGHYQLFSLELFNILSYFKHQLIVHDLVPNIEDYNSYDLMELGRHHGLPTPLLDFSYSPYVAIFFAFSECPINWQLENNGYSVIYALNIDALRWEIDRDIKKGENIFDGELILRERDLETFSQNLQTQNGHTFPVNAVKFIEFPGKLNKRMQRQQGCLIYETLFNFGNFEEYLDKLKEVDGSEMISKYVLHKIKISRNNMPQKFRILEATAMSAAQLYMDVAGAAIDAYNTFHYWPKNSIRQRAEDAKQKQ